MPRKKVTKKKATKKKLTINIPGRARGSAKLWLSFPDIHIPDHDPEALALAVEVGRILQPDYSLFLGDVLDAGVFSAHNKRTLQESQIYDYKETEVDPTNALLDEVQKNTKEKTYFLEGNHCARIERWAVNGGMAAQSLYKLISPYNTLAAHRDNFEFVPYNVPTGNRMGCVQIAKESKTHSGLFAIHGWSFALAAARIHLQKSRSQSILYGHSHRAAMEASRDPWTGRIIKAFNPGTLSKLQPLYNVGGNPSDWSHGVALIYVGQNSWTEYLISIVNGSCVLPDGRELRL